MSSIRFCLFSISLFVIFSFYNFVVFFLFHLFFLKTFPYISSSFSLIIQFPISFSWSLSFVHNFIINFLKSLLHNYLSTCLFIQCLFIQFFFILFLSVCSPSHAPTIFQASSRNMCPFKSPHIFKSLNRILSHFGALLMALL